MIKVDFKKELKHLYAPSSKEFEVVTVPEMNFIMIDGRGDPNTSVSYKEAVEALYAVAYKLKFISKKTLSRDYVVPPLEGLWWAEDMSVFTAGNKEGWEWTAMIMQPSWITEEMFGEASRLVEKSKNPPALKKMRFEAYDEGLSLQIMHIGPYADEGPLLSRLHVEIIPQKGYVENGKHHEIYLGDPRKTAPEKLKTVLRQPVKKASGR